MAPSGLACCGLPGFASASVQSHPIVPLCYDAPAAPRFLLMWHLWLVVPRIMSTAPRAHAANTQYNHTLATLSLRPSTKPRVARPRLETGNTACPDDETPRAQWG